MTELSAAPPAWFGPRRRFAPVQHANRCAGFAAARGRRTLDRGDAAAECVADAGRDLR
jgi:hypothetical protein